MSTRVIVFAAAAAWTVTVGCAEQPDETREIIDNLEQAGFPADDIMVTGGGVYIGRDAEVSLAASRELSVVELHQPGRDLQRSVDRSVDQRPQ